MLCRDLERRLADWTAGRLSAKQVEELQDHLLTCAACRERSNAFTRTLHALSMVFTDESPSPYFTSRVLARAGQTPAPRRSWVWLPAAGAAVVLLAITLSWLRPWTGSGPDSAGVVAGYEGDLENWMAAGDQADWNTEGIWTLPDDEEWEAI